MGLFFNTKPLTEDKISGKFKLKNGDTCLYRINADGKIADVDIYSKGKSYKKSEPKEIIRGILGRRITKQQLQIFVEDYDPYNYEDYCRLLYS